MYSFGQYLRENLTLAGALSTAAFLGASVCLFRGRWRREETLRRCLAALALSPLLYVLFCRLVDLGVFHLLRLLGFEPEGTLFFTIRIGANTFVCLGVLYMMTRAYREVTGAGKTLSDTVFLTFQMVTAVAVAMPSGPFLALTAVVLLGYMAVLMREEASFLAEQEAALEYRHFLLPVALSAVVVVGCMSEELVLQSELAASAAELRSTRGWICVFGFLFAIMIVLLEKNTVRGLRETWEARRSGEEIVRLNADLIDTQDKLIQAFSEILEGKSGQSGNHVKRVSAYSAALARAMGLDDETVHRIGVAAMMHDCGKLMIPNEILEKPGRLTDEEFEAMKRHVAYGEKMLTGVPGSIMEEALLIANQHHERWDGKGYLKHLAGDEIALSSQIVSVADVFDALTSRRCYKDAWDPREACDEIVRNKGTQFSPAAVEAFEKCYEECLEIMRTFRDEE